MSGIITRLSSESYGLADGPASAAKFLLPRAVAIAADEASVYIADRSNHRIRLYTLGDNQVATLAGGGGQGWADGPIGTAKFDTPEGVAVTKDGRYLLVADRLNRRIRRVNVISGDTTTIAGNGAQGWINGPGLQASFGCAVLLPSLVCQSAWAGAQL